MKIEYHGECIEVGDWESAAVEAEPGVEPPRISHAMGVTPGVSFYSEISLEIGDVFTETASGVKYQVTGQEGSKYSARPL